MHSRRTVSTNGLTFGTHLPYSLPPGASYTCDFVRQSACCVLAASSILIGHPVSFLEITLTAHAASAAAPCSEGISLALTLAHHAHAIGPAAECEKLTSLAEVSRGWSSPTLHCLLATGVRDWTHPATRCRRAHLVRRGLAAPSPAPQCGPLELRDAFEWVSQSGG